MTWYGAQAYNIKEGLNFLWTLQSKQTSTINVEEYVYMLLLVERHMDRYNSSPVIRGYQTSHTQSLIQCKCIWRIHLLHFRIVRGKNTSSVFTLSVASVHPSVGFSFFLSSHGLKLMSAHAVRSILPLTHKHIETDTNTTERHTNLGSSMPLIWSETTTHWRLSWTQHIINMKQHGKPSWMQKSWMQSRYPTVSGFVLNICGLNVRLSEVN